jgi:hypothetical protein
MKLLALTVLVAFSSLVGLTGCNQDTPAYSAKERFNQIGHNWSYEQSQANDDIDHFLLLRPAGGLTIWNVEHRN